MLLNPKISNISSSNTGMGLEPELEPEPKLWTKVEPKSLKEPEPKINT